MDEVQPASIEYVRCRRKEDSHHIKKKITMVLRAIMPAIMESNRPSYTGLLR